MVIAPHQEPLHNLYLFASKKQPFLGGLLLFLSFFLPNEKNVIKFIEKHLFLRMKTLNNNMSIEESVEFLQTHWEMLQTIADEHPNDNWCRVAADKAHKKLLEKKKELGL
jgi:hypothetical protein